MKRPRTKVTVVALFVLVIFLVIWKWDELIKAIGLWQTISWYYILAAIVLQLMSYGMSTLSLRKLFMIQGYTYPVIRLYKVVTIFNFLNRALPSLGVSGIAFIVSRMYQDGLSRGRSLIIAVLYYTNLYLAFFVLFIVSAFYIVSQHSVGQLHVKAIVIAVILVAIAYSLFVYIVSKKSRISKALVMVMKIIGLVSRRAREAGALKTPGLLHEIDEMYSSWRLYWKDIRHKLVPFMFAVLQHILDIATVYVVFAGLGQDISLSVLAAAYIVATVVSFVSFIPGGIGVFETAMVLVLRGFDVPLTQALSGVLAFRMLFYWLPVPIGFYFFKRINGTSVSLNQHQHANKMQGG